jgi:hypothetical protein
MRTAQSEICARVLKAELQAINYQSAGPVRNLGAALKESKNS